LVDKSNYKMEALIKLFNRDLEKLSNEIRSFKNKRNLWKTEGSISNSAGNLCLHLVGNLNHFIGAIIGDSGYIRRREKEFESTNIDTDKLIALVNDTNIDVISVLKRFDSERLKANYPIQVFGEDMTYEFFLIHLTTHLNYHLGQINYLRRMLED